MASALGSGVVCNASYTVIISRIIGGLGNQMFQYAAGRALSLRLHEPHTLDIGGFSAYQLHQGFELAKVFNCDMQTVGKAQIQSLLGWRSPQKMRSLLLKPQLKCLRGKSYVAEPYFHYWRGFQDIENSCYLAGYWQSEKYFRSVSQRIRQDFSFRHPLMGKNLQFRQQMGACHSVSLHVRRGDYVSDAHTHSTHGVCSLDYYHDAVACIAGKLSSPSFFIFSDDIDWCKTHLHIDFPCFYLDHNQGDESYRDMQMMSLCSHHIIANSSFSWWGAWLNPSSEKLVVAPKHWFAADHRTDDIIPPEWLVL